MQKVKTDISRFCDNPTPTQEEIEQRSSRIVGKYEDQVQPRDEKETGWDVGDQTLVS